MNELRASIIIEILGRPPERVTEALNLLLNKLGSEKGVKIARKNVNAPVPAKDSATLFTSFAEVELELDSVYALFGIVFAYLPSHVEIISPEKISISNVDLGEVASRLSEKLHDYDALAKRLIVDQEQLAKKLHEVAPHLFKQTEAQNSEGGPQQEKQKKISKKKTKKSGYSERHESFPK